MDLTAAAAAATRAAGKWLVCPEAKRWAGCRLFTFASAGLGPAMFRRWAALLPSQIELCIPQLPGREMRWNEPPFVSMGELLPALGGALKGAADRPFIFFGHSLGALIAFEMSRYLRSTFGLTPALLIVAAARAPQLPNRYARIAGLPAPQFMAAIDERHRGIAPELAESPEIVDFMLPTLMADYRIFEDYDYRAAAPLVCPIAVFGGIDDACVTRDDLEAWREQTSGAFTLSMLPGGHFFVHDQAEVIVTSLLEARRPPA